VSPEGDGEDEKKMQKEENERKTGRGMTRKRGRR
jgi:hypothetical protein